MSAIVSRGLPKQARKDNAVHASLSQIHLSKNAGSLRKLNPTDPMVTHRKPGCPTWRTVVPNSPSVSRAAVRLGSGASRAPPPPCQPGQSSEPDRPTRQNSIQETKTADHPAKAGSSIRNISEMTGQPDPPVPKDPLAAADEQPSRDPIPARQRTNDKPMRFSRRLRDRRA